MEVGLRVQVQKKNKIGMKRILIVFSLIIIAGGLYSLHIFRARVEPDYSNPDDFVANDLTITNIIIGNGNITGKYRMITFDIKWTYSWRTNTTPGNWDAAWVFVK